jgi:hypothetical protein
MPSPFPGMDPYLEHPASWQGTHNMFIAFLVESLNAVLPSRYVATSEVRCYIAASAPQTIRPDLAVTERPHAQPQANRSGVAVVGDPFVLVRGYPLEEHKEAYVNITDVKSGNRIVTAIELLSYTNKTLRNEGRALYRAKQTELLASNTHFIEIDLLRTGEHTVAVPEALLPPESPRDYVVCLHRSGHGLEYAVWPISIRQRLPRIAVPLDEDVQDMELDLQAVFNRLYDAGAYGKQIDYTQNPVPPLSAEDAAWANALLHEHGLRD